MPSEPSDAPRSLAAVLAAAILARRGVLVSLFLLAGLALLARGVWGVSRASVAKDPRYLVTAQSVRVSAPPPWVRADVVAATLQQPGLAGELSILDPPELLEDRVTAALGGHPWVRRVGAIAKAPPNQLDIEVEYREPLAAVEVGGALLPVDADAALLPSDDFSHNQLRRMRRIHLTDVQRPPETGQVWDDPRVVGAAALVEALGPCWSEFNLFQVKVDRTPDARAGRRFWSYNLESTGSTVIVWGAAPGFGPPDESPFARKLESLRRAVTKHGPLDSVVESPALIDVRDGGVAYPRVVMKGDRRVAATPDDETKVK